MCFPAFFTTACVLELAIESVSCEKKAVHQSFKNTKLKCFPRQQRHCNCLQPFFLNAGMGLELTGLGTKQCDIRFHLRELYNPLSVEYCFYQGKFKLLQKTSQDLPVMASVHVKERRPTPDRSKHPLTSGQEVFGSKADQTHRLIKMLRPTHWSRQCFPSPCLPPATQKAGAVCS